MRADAERKAGAVGVVGDEAGAVVGAIDRHQLGEPARRKGFAESESGNRPSVHGMIMRTYSITAEPVGPAYRELLRFGTQLGGTFSLTVRKTEDLSPAGNQILARLANSIVKEESLSQWPGTVLLSGVARVATYVTNSGSVAVLSTSVERLYDWGKHGLPEDLCFYREDGRCWLASISHEHDAFLMAAEQELSDLLVRTPALRVREDMDAPES
jgi:hypothetical protein